jgi:hypothetical protein
MGPEGLDSSIEYDAVSYYWGDINSLEDVTIHGSDQGVSGLDFKVPVTKNLTAALRRLRARASANQEPLRLWTDALCINQTDAMERQIQVEWMQSIFLRARSVLIWLGESNELVERGLAALVGATTSRHSLDSAQFLSTTLSLDQEVVYIKQFAALNALSYWRRGWTFQENMTPEIHLLWRPEYPAPLLARSVRLQFPLCQKD